MLDHTSGHMCSGLDVVSFFFNLSPEPHISRRCSMIQYRALGEFVFFYFFPGSSCFRCVLTVALLADPAPVFCFFCVGHTEGAKHNRKKNSSIFCA